MNELEIKKALQFVEESIRNVASVEGELLMPSKIGNVVYFKFKNGNNYKVVCMNKSTEWATLDTIQPSDIVDDNSTL